MLNVDKLCASAEACMGWPYVSPGSNDRNGIDCSGLLVKCFRDQGGSIAHGSNTIWRKYLTDKGSLTGTSQLETGMAVFKWKAQDTAKYPDGQGDFHHVGLVLSVYPLLIIHASSAAGCVTTDTTIGKWTHWGRLKNVNYKGGGGMYIPSEPELLDMPDDPVSNQPEAKAGYAFVTAELGRTVNLRANHSMGAKLLERVPLGECVETLGTYKDWTKIRYKSRTGWMMTQFLIMDNPDEDLDAPLPGDGVTILISGLTESEAEELQRQYPQAVKSYG